MKTQTYFVIGGVVLVAAAILWIATRPSATGTTVTGDGGGSGVAGIIAAVGGAVTSIGGMVAEAVDSGDGEAGPDVAAQAGS